MAARKATKSTKTKATTRPKTSRTKKSTSTRKVSESTNKKFAVMNSGLVSRCVSACKKNNKIYILIAFLIIAGLLYLGRSLIVVSFVNGRPIFRYSVVRKLESLGGKQVSEELIRKELVLQKGREAGISITDSEIAEEVDLARKSLESQASLTGGSVTLEEVLDQQGVTMPDFLDGVRLQLILKKLLASEINISDEDVRKAYDDNKAFYKDQDFESVKDDIKEGLFQESLNNRIQIYMQELRNNAKIINLVNY